MKDRLIFDTTDVDTIADSDSVGAYLRSSDGSLLTHTDVGGKLSLDVNVANDIAVDIDHVNDSIKIGDGTDFLAVNADGSINVVATATDLDIRDLAFATDKVDVSGSSVTVSATDLDIRDLSSASDSVSSWLSDGSGNAIGSTAGSLDVNVSNTIDTNDAALADTAIASGAESLASANTAQDVVASPLANRKYLHIYNNDNRVMYVGQSGVTAANGFPLSPSSRMELRAGASVDIEFVSAKVGHDVRHLELS